MSKYVAACLIGEQSEGNMYEKKLQLDLGDFLFPIGKLNPKKIPWDKIEKIRRAL